jgi:hypothetical protein
MSALTAHVRRLASSGATRSEIIHKMKADGFAEADVAEVVDRILAKTALQQEQTVNAETKARKGVLSIALGAVLLLIGFASLFALADPHATHIRLYWGPLVAGALMMVRGLRAFLQ